MESAEHLLALFFKPATQVTLVDKKKVTVYNLLPADIVQLDNVKKFQRAVAGLLKKRSQAGCEDWQLTCSPRMRL